MKFLIPLAWLLFFFPCVAAEFYVGPWNPDTLITYKRNANLKIFVVVVRDNLPQRFVLSRVGDAIS